MNANLTLCSFPGIAIYITTPPPYTSATCSTQIVFDIQRRQYHKLVIAKANNEPLEFPPSSLSRALSILRAEFTESDSGKFAFLNCIQALHSHSYLFACRSFSSSSRLTTASTRNAYQCRGLFGKNDFMTVSRLISFLLVFEKERKGERR
jgi:hypothetical protein